ncbi:lipid kinase YegS [Chelatococcus asaccharovorans]|uniref:lipid kinase YegS n=1 Tax=Chelatococcus asaccharovorans TaxID=28210 RepID=UPI00224C67BF|nr:lipid kinase YegS [Chelatococcus asaccharovorans]CAH1665001.1 putative lipid kinase YegS-like [Chelatococcus asaccharovorans]CAH1682165.1 putative lipid kinase YegS-like [Chelatococcus asaccharovorans]
MTKLRIILHGKAAGDLRVRQAVRSLRRDGHGIGVRVTYEAGDAARMAQEAVEAARHGDVDVIVAGGGDGTVNEVFSAGLAAHPPDHCSFGILPLGTANDFARAAEIPVTDVTAALRLAAESPARLIDVGQINDRGFINVMTGGFGSRVTVETDPELKRHLGGLAYLLTGLSRFRELSSNSGRFRAEGFEWEGRFLALAIGNGRQAGGGIRLCPDALIDDGLLDLMILPELSPDKRLDAFGRLLSQGAVAIEELVIRVKSPWIDFTSDDVLHVNLDGEPMHTTQFHALCVRRALAVHLGSTALLAEGGGVMPSLPRTHRP